MLIHGICVSHCCWQWCHCLEWNSCYIIYFRPLKSRRYNNVTVRLVLDWLDLKIDTFLVYNSCMHDILINTFFKWGHWWRHDVKSSRVFGKNRHDHFIIYCQHLCVMARDIIVTSFICTLCYRTLCYRTLCYQFLVRPLFSRSASLWH